jgi:tetratricopeptide (TPR) repeat protein
MQQLNQLSIIETLVRQFKANEALLIIEGLLENGQACADVYFWRGKIYQQQQQYGLALNSFENALMHDANHQGAITGINMVNAILQIVNSYYYENPYTEDTLYE